MRKKIVAGNWKMHGNCQSNASLVDAILEGVGSVNCEVVVCPPFPYLAQVSSRLSLTSVSLGAQTVSQFPQGAFTGEVSASMLAEFGCQYVLVGHSERRSLCSETDDLVAEKAFMVFQSGMRPIVCVGETLAEREAGKTDLVIQRQVGAILQRLNSVGLGGVVIAYEPVWAIGTGRTATPEQAQEVHSAIRAQVSACDPVAANELRILYGGSVKPQSAAELFVQPDIDGGLVGGAALVADDFLAICLAASC